jgi:hypothetical protein
MQVQRIDGAIAERDLVIVRIVQRLRQRVGGMELVVVREAVIDRKEQRVVMRVDAGFQVLDHVRSSDHRVVDLSDRHSQDEVRSKIVNAIGAHHPVLGELILDSKIELLHRRFEGWHFRNEANSGPNTGDVNAPDEHREFFFSPKFGTCMSTPENAAQSEFEAAARDGIGVLEITDLTLGTLKPGEKANIQEMKFTVHLAVAQSACEPCGQSMTKP